MVLKIFDLDIRPGQSGTHIMFTEVLRIFFIPLSVCVLPSGGILLLNNLGGGGYCVRII